MGLLGRDDPEQAEAKLESKRQKAFEKALARWWDSPAGNARDAFEAGDHVFQYELDVHSQRAKTSAMSRPTTRSSRTSANETINAICNEGWELITANFVFAMTGQDSRDRFFASGQQASVSGSVTGYYVFRRCAENLEIESEEDLRQAVWNAVLEDVT